MSCRICKAESDGAYYTVREMMFGSREEFEYLQCAACQCLQIREVPNDLAKYYPANYYSFDGGKQPGAVKRWRTRHRDRFALTGRGVIGKILHGKHPDPRLSSLRRISMTSAMGICDVGCGSGALLDSLALLGFTDLCGVDPHIDRDIKHANGVDLRKTRLQEIDRTFDVIMFHHTFEHMPDPADTLRAAGERLTDQGVCLIRIPVVPCFAWERYGVNWVQLDAPRHLFLHSVESIRHLAGQAGLRVTDVVYDSTRFQFLGSERYANDIPLNTDKRTRRRAKALFTQSKKRQWSKQAVELNRTKRGDQAAFYLSK